MVGKCLWCLITKYESNIDRNLEFQKGRMKDERSSWDPYPVLSSTASSAEILVVDALMLITRNIQ
jgi:hypothetical protein